MNPNPILAVIPRDVDGIIRVTCRPPGHPPTVPPVEYTFAKAKEACVYIDGKAVVIGESGEPCAYFPAELLPVVTAPLQRDLA